MSDAQGRRSTLKDVARLAGVSLTSASMALSDSPRVSAVTKEAVGAAAAQLRYVPHAAGRALRSRARQEPSQSCSRIRASTSSRTRR